MYEIPWFLSGERKTFEGIASPELGILWKYFSNIRYFYIFYRNVFLLQNFEAMFLWNEKAIQIVAGPCSVESEEQLFATARGLKKIGIQTLRGGIWKPRSRAHHFEGVGEPGLRWLQQVQQELSMQVATEVATPRQAEVALKYGLSDYIQHSPAGKMNRFENEIVFRVMRLIFEDGRGFTSARYLSQRLTDIGYPKSRTKLLPYIGLMMDMRIIEPGEKPSKPYIIIKSKNEIRELMEDFYRSMLSDNDKAASYVYNLHEWGAVRRYASDGFRVYSENERH